IGVAWAVAVFGCEAAFTLLAIPVLGRHGPWGVSVHATWLATVMFAVLGASRAGLLTGIAPVAAAVSGVLLGGPAPRPLVWAGIAVVAVGLALGFRKGRTLCTSSTTPLS